MPEWVILSGVGVYQYLVDWGGAGATVPLTGFGHLLAKGVRKAVGENGLIGALTGGSTAAAGGIQVEKLSSLDRDLLKDTLGVVKQFKVLLNQRFHLEAL